MRHFTLALVGFTSLALLSLPAFAGYGQTAKTECIKIVGRSDRSKKVVHSSGEEKGRKISSAAIISE